MCVFVCVCRVREYLSFCKSCLGLCLVGRLFVFVGVCVFGWLFGCVIMHLCVIVCVTMCMYVFVCVVCVYV